LRLDAQEMDNDHRKSASPAPASGNCEVSMPVAWREFVQFCQELRYGEIERLSIQDGLPVLAEVTKKKVKFTRDH
jgi:hypothetical protein